nr:MULTISPECIES: hypothetical protein [Rhizobium]
MKVFNRRRAVDEEAAARNFAQAPRSVEVENAAHGIEPGNAADLAHRPQMKERFTSKMGTG